MKSLIPANNVDELICLIRGCKVMLDEDLAGLYGVSTKRLNEQVRRNKKRFPNDFMFQLTVEEANSLRSQFATLKAGRGRHRKYLPLVFTEQGVAMLSGVLNSDRAIDVNIMIMRAFVRIRRMLSLNRALAKRLAAIEQRLTGHDADVRQLYDLFQEMQQSPHIAGVGFCPAP
jgi:hypothetical protein